MVTLSHLLMVLALSADALTLKDCYELALKRSEAIAIRQEQIKETEGRFLQALGTALPDVSFVLSERRQDTSGASSSILRDVPEKRFEFTQPLFSGFQEFAALAVSRAERRQLQHARARAEQLLLVDVANAFYLLQEKREDLDALAASRQALAERVHELRGRERLGRSRPSEVVSADAQLRRIDAELEAARRDEETTEQLLEFLTGLDDVGPVADPGFTIPALGPVEQYVARAGARPDVKSAQEAWSVERREVGVAQGDLWPDIDLESNYYTERVGSSAEVDWDVLLTVDVPLFQGGKAVGAVKEAKSEARQAKLAFAQTRRAAELDIRDTYTQLAAALARHTALEQALAAAEDNYRMQIEDYRRSLVNNLDVLSAIQLLEDARREVITARYEIRRLYWTFKVTVGEDL